MNELERNEAVKNHRLVLEITTQIKRNLWDLAIVLKAIRDNRQYRYYNETWTEYLANPEIGLSRFFAHKIIFNYEIWVEQYHVSQEKLKDIDSEKLYIAGTMATTEDYELVLEQARTLSRSDLRHLKAGTSPYDSTESKMVICPKCHHQFQVRLN